jgi:phenylpropionate dioxygenase-like ring-hydroxylating dioxygenase large terminal subunit
VWVYSTPGVEPTSEPPRFPKLEQPGYTTVRREFVVDAPLYALVENILDVPHTAFLHGGLFRTAKKANVIEVVVRRHDTWAEAEFVGEPVPTGLLGRLLAPGGGVVQHVDRFLLPSLAQVEYRLGAKSHLLATSALTPEHASRTRVYAVVTFCLPLPGWLVSPFIAPVAHRVFAQDAVMLRRQAEQVARFGGERFTSTELDVLGPQVARAAAASSHQAGAGRRGARAPAAHEHLTDHGSATRGSDRSDISSGARLCTLHPAQSSALASAVRKKVGGQRPQTRSGSHAGWQTDGRAGTKGTP